MENTKDENEFVDQRQPDAENIKNRIDESQHIESSKNTEVIEGNDEETSEENVIYPSVDITPDKDGGIMKQIIKPGEGEDTPNPGDRVTIHYKGYMHVGSSLKPFDSSQDKCQFALGKGVIIRGLDLGLLTMKKNEHAFFIIQPQYAYGELGHPPTIPPMCVLFYEVCLFDWKLEDLSIKKDDGILRKILQKGEGTSFPNDGALVKVGIIGYYNNKEFENREVEFILGEGCNLDIPEGLEIALLKFKLHEKSMIYLKSKYAFNSNGKPDADIPPNADLEYELILHSFERVKEIWEMSSDEKYQYALEAKAKGLSFFEANNYKIALKYFKKIVTYLENEPGVSFDSQQERKELLIAGYLNVSLCQAKLENYLDAIKICDKVLVLEPKNEKALYRRAQSRMAINDFELALEDLQQLIVVNPFNMASRKLIISCQDEIKKYRMKERGIFGNMFKKFAEQDEEERRRRNINTETGVWDDEKENTCDEAIVKMLSTRNSS